VSCTIPTPSCLAASIAADAFGGIVTSLETGFGDAVKLLMTFWTAIPTPTFSASSGPVGNLRGSLAWITAAVAVGALLVAAGRLALQRKAEPAVDATRGLVTLVVAAGVGVPAVAALTVAGDALSSATLNAAGGGALGAKLAGLVTTMGPLGVGLGFILAILGMISAFAQVFLLLIRVGVLVMLTGALPLFAAASSTRSGRATLAKAVSWLLAFVLYKPAAAFVYAAAFWLIGSGDDGVKVLSGLSLMILAIVALPGLLRLLTPQVAAAVSGGGGGTTALAAGMVVATGARAFSTRGGGGGSSAPSPAPAGPPGATSRTAAGAATGTAGAPLVGLIAQGAGAAKAAAASAVPNHSSSNGKDPQ